MNVLRRQPPARADSVDDVAALGYQHWLGGGSPVTAVAALPGRLRRAWGRSLQLRVGVTTLLVTGVFVFLIGVYLTNRISAGVLTAKRSSALVQARTGRTVALQNLQGVSAGDVLGALTVLQQLFPAPSDDGGPDTGLYYTSIRSSAPVLQTSFPNQPPVPGALSDTVRKGYLALQYAPVSPPGKHRTTTALIVGQLVTAPSTSFELYYIFPLTAEQQTIDLVQRTVLVAGIGLMLLIAIIAVLVTRQAVGPVRTVSQTARKLSDGDLTQRVPVQGTDELAVLAGSFNDMASSLQRQFRALEELSRLQRRFTSDVSHELRTPLTTVRMAAEMIYARREEFPADLARSSELMYEELDRFEALLGDLLEISRYDAGVARLEVETVDLRTIVDSSVAGTRHLALQKGCDVVVHAALTPVLADVDPRRIERILRNLIGNAIDHSEGRPVVIRIASDGTAAIVSVRDQGVGLRPGEAGLVFNRFWRGDPSRSRLTGGTGLGLAISLEDARLHGGWLQAWGERGHGALFRLTVPLRAGSVLPNRPGPLEPNPGQDAEDGLPPVQLAEGIATRSSRSSGAAASSARSSSALPAATESTVTARSAAKSNSLARDGVDADVVASAPVRLSSAGGSS